MITCLGLVVGLVESTSVQDVLNQCAKFLKKYQYLSKVIDTHKDNNEVMILCKIYNGSTKIGTSAN